MTTTILWLSATTAVWLCIGRRGRRYGLDGCGGRRFGILVRTSDRDARVCDLRPTILAGTSARARAMTTRGLVGTISPGWCTWLYYNIITIITIIKEKKRIFFLKKHVGNECTRAVITPGVPHECTAVRTYGPMKSVIHV